jgi:hypothetical protein
VPLFKSGDSKIFSNYRPVSILSVFSKLLENIMFTRLSHFVRVNDLLYQLQFGFRKAHSTSHALTLLADKISDAIDKGHYTFGIFLDFSKAFDTVNHDILFKKLFAYGIKGPTLDWIKSYLHNRQQFVSFDGHNSSYCSITCGVPQGSVLGPLLFILYINDIANVSELLFLLLFADDTSALISGPDIHVLQNVINSELKSLLQWLNCNKLSLNVDKSKFIIFTTKKIDHNINIILNGQSLERIQSTKFLGVYIDEKLSWKQHIHYMQGKIAKAIGIINLCKKYFSENTLVNLYYSFVYPLFIYNLEVWGSACNSALQCLVILQKRCIKLITHSPRKTKSDPLFKRLGILPLLELYKMKVLLFLYNYLNNCLPSVFYVANYFLRNSTYHVYNTRNADAFTYPTVRTELRKRSLRYMAIPLYNCFCEKVDFNIRVSLFKKCIKDILFSNLIE